MACKFQDQGNTNNGQCHEVCVGFYSGESHHYDELLSKILSSDILAALNSTNQLSPPQVSADTNSVKAGRESRDASISNFDRPTPQSLIHVDTCCPRSSRVETLDALSITIWLVLQPRAPLPMLIDEGTGPTRPGTLSQTEYEGIMSRDLLRWMDSMKDWFGFALIVRLISLSGSETSSGGLHFSNSWNISSAAE